MSDPERLRPGENRQALTERAAAAFATLAERLRAQGHDPQAVAHFINRPVCQVCQVSTKETGLETAPLLPKLLARGWLGGACFTGGH